MIVATWAQMATYTGLEAKASCLPGTEHGHGDLETE